MDSKVKSKDKIFLNITTTKTFLITHNIVPEQVRCGNIGFNGIAVLKVYNVNGRESLQHRCGKRGCQNKNQYYK